MIMIASPEFGLNSSFSNHVVKDLDSRFKVFTMRLFVELIIEIKGVSRLIQTRLRILTMLYILRVWII